VWHSTSNHPQPVAADPWLDGYVCSSALPRNPHHTWHASLTHVSMFRPGGTVLCNCSNPSTKLTARTGANNGREFFKCASRDEQAKCDFFQWADELGPPCKCDRLTSKRTAKQGANQGASFACWAARLLPEYPHVVFSIYITMQSPSVHREIGAEFYGCAGHPNGCDFFECKATRRQSCLTARLAAMPSGWYFKLMLMITTPILQGHLVLDQPTKGECSGGDRCATKLF